MRYDLMAQEALRGVVRAALAKAAEDGLPGNHHFYISFRTRFPGVQMDDKLLEKYPDTMTIVLEHQFWDLAALDDFFEVTLSFDGAPKYIKVPYRAVTSFHDPGVGFGLQFETPEDEQEDEFEEEMEMADNTDLPQADGTSGEVVSLDAFRRK